MRTLLALLLSSAIASCDRIVPSEPRVTVQLDSLFTLRPGQEAIVDGTNLRLRFLGVPEDSRCPVDVMCVWEGNARVQVARDHGVAVKEILNLHTSTGPRSEAAHGYRVTLERLEPAPHSEQRIPPERYAATLRVSPAT